MALEPTTASPASPAAAAPAAAAPAVSAAPAAAPAVVESAPVSVAPVVSETPAVVAAAETPAVVETPAVETPAVVETPAAEAPAAETPVEIPAVESGAEKPAEAVVAEAPKAFEFKLPETVKADAAVMAAYNNVLGKYNISQEAGQELIDFHANAIKTTSEQMTQHQLDAWANTNKEWVSDFEKTAGNRRDTLLNDAKFAITDTIKDAKQRKELWDVLAFTGAGNHKAVISGLAAIGKRLRERGAASPSPSVNGARSGTPADRRYGGTTKTQG